MSALGLLGCGLALGIAAVFAIGASLIAAGLIAECIDEHLQRRREQRGDQEFCEQIGVKL